MPNDAVNSVTSSQPWLWCNRILWSVVAMFVLGSMARTFVSKEPFDAKKFFGEIIFSTIGAIAMYSMGLMQGMNEIQIIGFGAFASLGGVRTVEWILKLSSSAKAIDSHMDK